MKLSELEDADQLLTKDQFEVVLTKLENKLDARFNTIDAKFNAIDARFNGQRLWFFALIITGVAQVITAIFLHR
jgi:hypothetical protein